MKKLLIFGVGGFVGPYLAKEFLNHGYKIYGSDINAPTNSCFEFTKVNLLNYDEVEKLVLNLKPDLIINLAAISSVGMSWSIPQTTISINVIGALNIMEAARKLEFKPKVMFIGSSEEYSASLYPISEDAPLDANNPYGISKVTQERFAEIYRKRYGMKVYCVRPFNHTGVGQRDSFVLASFCKQITEIEKSGKSGTIKVGNLAVKRDFSDVRDVVRAYRMVIEKDDSSKIYNVGSGVAYSLKELLDYIISLSNQKIEVKYDASRIRVVDTPYICCDSTAIKKDVGWKPKYNIKDTLKEMYQYYLDSE